MRSSQKEIKTESAALKALCTKHSTLCECHQIVWADIGPSFNCRVPRCPVCVHPFIFTFCFLQPHLLTRIPSRCLLRLSYPFGLQHRQEGHWPSPRGFCPGQRRPLWVGVSPAHVGQRREASAQDGGRPPPAALPPSHRPLLWARVQSAGRQDQRFEDMMMTTVR